MGQRKERTSKQSKKIENISNPNSTSGKILLTDVKSVVSSKDICKIIKTCAKYKVHEVEISGLHLVFGPKDQTAPKAQTRPTDKVTIEAEEQALQDAALRYLEDLKIADPFAYEKFIGGELTGGQTT